MLIDLHTHTFPRSTDSSIGIDVMIDIAKQRNLDGVCLSDHDALWTPGEIEELSRRHSFLILPAIEVTTDLGHMLSYGLSTFYPEMFTFGTFLKEVQAASAIIIAAHPFRDKIPPGLPGEAEFAAAVEEVSRNPAFPHCVALETVNGRSGQVENLHAAEVAALLNMAQTAGTDTHLVAEVGRCATEFDRPIRTLSDLIEELRAGRFRPVELNMLVSAAVTDHEFSVDDTGEDYGYDE